MHENRHIITKHLTNPKINQLDMTQGSEQIADVEHQSTDHTPAHTKERCSDACCLISAVFIIFGIFVASAMLNSSPTNARHFGYDDDDTSSSSYTSSTEETSSDDDHIGNIEHNTTKKLNYDLAMLKMQIDREIVPCTNDEIDLAYLFFNHTCFRPGAVIDVGCIILEDPAATENTTKPKHFIYIGVSYMSQKLQLTIIPQGMLIRETVSKATKTIDSYSASIADDLLNNLDEIYLRSSHDYFCCNFYTQRNLPAPLDCA